MSAAGDLDRYLARIGYRGTPRVDVETLRAIHRAHLLAIPYENLDVQLGRPVGLAIDRIYTKLVEERRGGWCYEMNGLLAWALESLGFRLTRLSAGVMRAARGDAAIGNHLALWVHVEDGFLADVGFGDGVLEPFPIVEGTFRQRFLEFRLERLPGGWWRFHNHADGGVPSFDFVLEPADVDRLDRQCRFLQTSPESPFTRIAIVQRHRPDGLAILRGRVLKRVCAGGVSTRVVAGADDYAWTLREVFDLEPPALAALWTKVEGQHAAFVA
jgi:N-hydroxyarylamine O-acetyltransferase